MTLLDSLAVPGIAWWFAMTSLRYFRRPSTMARLQNPFANYDSFLREDWSARATCALMSLAGGAPILLVGSSLSSWPNAATGCVVAVVACYLEEPSYAGGKTVFDTVAVIYKGLLLVAYVVTMSLAIIR